MERGSSQGGVYCHYVRRRCYLWDNGLRLVVGGSFPVGPSLLLHHAGILKR